LPRAQQVGPAHTDADGGSSPDHLGASRLPETFGRYVLLERLGEGGMAEVFRAVVPGAEGFRREVVVKRILDSLARAATFVDMFAQEARISALLHHPNIVQVFDFGRVDGSYFLAMELLDGWEVGAINKALRKKDAKMPIEVAVHIAHEVLLGLSYAHTLEVQGHRPQIVHRDVSPTNIMCLRAGGVKLLDFGVASTAEARESSDLCKLWFRGKYSYAAPEYVRGKGHDARIDLFAVGVVLWEMLVGTRLFRGTCERDTLAAVLGAPIAPPSSQRAAVPTELDRIVMKALERDPAARYQSAAHMAEELEQVLRERDYRQRMLPRLLHDLFGEAPSNPAAVIAVEELIQSGSTIPPATISPRPRRRSRSDRTLGFLLSRAAAALLVVGAAATLCFSLMASSPRADGVAARASIQPPKIAKVMPEIHPLIHALPSPAIPSETTEPAVQRAAPSRAHPSARRRWKLASTATRKPAVRKPRAPAPARSLTRAAPVH
jgi:serine/threonine protein kinase